MLHNIEKSIWKTFQVILNIKLLIFSQLKNLIENFKKYC
jgi:hypothetical protein